MDFAFVFVVRTKLLTQCELPDDPAPPVLTGDVRPRREYPSYLAAAFGIALIVLLVVGTAAYAGIHAFYSPTVAANGLHGMVLIHHVAPDPIVALDAVILAMIGLLAVVGASSPPSLKSTRAPNR